MYPPFKLGPIPDPRSINMVAPPAPQGSVGGGLLARIQERMMPTPSSGLLTEQDIKNARQQGLLGLGASLLADSGARPQGTAPGFMESIGRGIQNMQGGYQGAQQQALATRAAEQQMQLAQQQGQLQQQEIAANQGTMDQETARQAALQKLFAENPPPADPAGYVEWAKGMWAKVAPIDPKLADHLKTIIATQGQQQQQKQEGTYVTTPGPDGRPVRRWVSQAEAAQGVPEYERPQRDTDESMTINSRFLNEERLEKSYGAKIEGVQTTVDAYMGAKRAASMGGAGDLQILYSFIKALDPGSVVREGEVALAREAASVWSRAHILKSKLESEGGTLSPVQREQMLSLMKQMVELKAKRTREALKSSEQRAQDFGLNVYLHNPLEAYEAFERGGQENEFGVVSGGSSTAAGSDLRSKYGGLR